MEILVFKSDPKYLPLVIVLSTTVNGIRYNSNTIEMMPNDWCDEKEKELKQLFEEEVNEQIKSPN